MEQRNEPSTEEIVRALRCDGCKGTCSECFFGFEEKDSIGYDTWGCRRGELDNAAADRLESLERELSGITGELERFRTFHERYAEQTSKKYIDDICALAARAESAERERDDVEKSLARRIMKHLSDNEFDSTDVCEICEYNLINSPKCLSCGSDYHYGENFELKHTLRGLPQDGGEK